MESVVKIIGNYQYTFNNPELDLYISKEYDTTVNSYIEGNNHVVKVNNQYDIQQYPYITINFTASVTNPILNYQIGKNTTPISIQISASFVNGDKLYIDCRSKIAKKNTLIIPLPSFPVIQQQQYFKLTIDKTYATLTMKYKTYSNIKTRIPFREDVNIQSSNKKIQLPKRFYNSTSKETISIGNDVSFDFSLGVSDEMFLDQINSYNTYRIEGIMKNQDDERNMDFVLCRCNLDVSFSGSGSDIFKYKVNGNGILLQEVS